MCACVLVCSCEYIDWLYAEHLRLGTMIQMDPGSASYLDPIFANMDSSNCEKNHGKLGWVMMGSSYTLAYFSMLCPDHDSK